MRLRLLLVMAAVMAAGWASCGDDDSGEAEDRGRSADETGRADQHDDGRRDGGEISVAVGFLENLEPHVAGFPTDSTVPQMVWRGLYSLTPDNRLTDEQNGIADGLPEVSEDGTTVTVRMQQGLTWSDGDDLRAEDYVAGIIRSCSPVISKTGVQYLLSNLRGCNDFYLADPASADLGALQAAVGVHAVDALTIEFKLEQPQPSFPAVLSLPLTFPVPVHLDRFAAQTPEAPAEWGTEPTQLVYNGPYTLNEFVAGERAAFEPNPRWSGTTQPTLDRIVFRSLDPVEAQDAYRSGEIQVTTIQGDQLIGAPSEFGDEYFQEIRNSTRALYMNLEEETLAHLDVRLALARAIDREALDRAIPIGGFIPTTIWIPEVMSGLSPDSYEDVIGFDAEAARQHLASAGYPDGEGFPALALMSPDRNASPDLAPAAEFLQQSFQEVLNIEIELELVDRDTFFERLAVGDFQLFVLGWTQDYPDPENWILGHFDTEGAYNDPGCSDPDIDALINEARFNPNDEERRQQYTEVERLAIERVCGRVPYAHQGLSFLVKADLLGFKENASGNDVQVPGEGVPEAWGLRDE